MSLALFILNLRIEDKKFLCYKFQLQLSVLLERQSLLKKLELE